jgi:hypothetical protein
MPQQHVIELWQHVQIFKKIIQSTVRPEDQNTDGCTNDMKRIATPCTPLNAFFMKTPPTCTIGTTRFTTSPTQEQKARHQRNEIQQRTQQYTPPNGHGIGDTKFRRQHTHAAVARTQIHCVVQQRPSSIRIFEWV